MFKIEHIGGLMENKVKRRSLEEIYADMDRVNKRKPTSQQIEELGEVIRKINEENQDDQTIIPDKKIARPNIDMESHDH